MLLFVKNAIVFIAGCALLLPSSVFAYTFAANLRLGDTGPDVLALQQILNSSPDTAIASSGPGSPGQETNYFGAKTFDAVNRFQTKYFNEVLAPSGLIRPTGFVGVSTRAQLEKLSSQNKNEPVVSSVLESSSGTQLSSAALPPMPTRIELYLAEVKNGLQERGESEDTIAFVEAEIRKIAPNAEAYLSEFYKQEQELYKKKQAGADAPALAFFKRTLSTIASLFTPATAHAALGLPFGGYVATVMPVCTCTPAVSQIFILLPNPNALVSNMNLDYVLGTQAFSWHNLPLPGVATLGLYEPSPPTCWIGFPPKCVPLPSRGVITPISGSSLTPL